MFLFLVGKDGDYLSVQGTGTSDYISFNIPCEIPSGTKVYFYVPEGNVNNMTFYLRDEEHGLVSGLSVNGSCTPTKDVAYLRIVCDLYTYNTKLKIMLSTKENAEWEPFVGNEPSPNMNYPQKVECHGESGSIGGEVLAGNIIPPTTNESTTSNGVTFDVLEDGIIHAHGTSTGNAEFKYIGGWMAKTGVTIPKGFVFPKTINGVTINMYGYNDTGSYEHISSTDNSGYSDVSVLLNMGAGYTVNTLVRPYTCKEEVLTDYAEPQPFTFQTPNGLRGIPLGQTIPNTIKNSPIHMSGVYHDGEQYWIADTKNENGKDVQRVFKTTIDGNSNIFDYGNPKTSSNIFGYGISGIVKNSLVLCNNMTCHEVWGGDFEGIWVGADDSISIRLTNDLTGITTEDSSEQKVTKVKELLTNNPIEIYYWKKDEPIITDTTEEEKAQLDNLVMNYPNTTIVNDEGAYMEVEYVCDTQEHIKQNYVSKAMHEEHENRIAELEKAIVNS